MIVMVPVELEALRPRPRVIRMEWLRYLPTAEDGTEAEDAAEGEESSTAIEPEAS